MWLPDEAATLAHGEALARALPPGSIVALAGPLGAGKTTLVKGMARALGIDPARVTSPTFVLVQSHEGLGGRLVHADAFRIGAREYAALDLPPPGARLVAVEWADRVRAAIPPGAVWVALEGDPRGGRLARRARD